MTENARLLEMEEFRALSLNGLLADRAMMRDVHFTINRAIFTKNRKILDLLLPVAIMTDWEDEKQIVVELKYFKLLDDLEHSYFFDLEWPDMYLDFLREDDIIASYIFGAALSYDIAKAAIKRLVEEKVYYEKYFSAADVAHDPNLKDIVQTAEDDEGFVYDREKGLIINVPITSLPTLFLALHERNKRVEDMLGFGLLDFTKPLKRSDGRKIERYNHITSAWEICANQLDAGRFCYSQILDA